jgi:hypothetical protein
MKSWFAETGGKIVYCITKRLLPECDFLTAFLNPETIKYLPKSHFDGSEHRPPSPELVAIVKYLTQSKIDSKASKSLKRDRATINRFLAYDSQQQNKSNYQQCASNWIRYTIDQLFTTKG